MTANPIYVALGDLDNSPIPWEVKNTLMDDYRAWLEEHLGAQGESWQYRFGGRYAQGILFEVAKDATAFKLKFKV